MATKAIDVEWVPFNTKITVDLDVEDRNPVLANLLWNHLPYNSLQNHALVSGKHLYHIAPIPELVYTTAQFKVADRTTCPDGTMFLSSLRHMAIKYGSLTENLPAAPVGHVRPDHIAQFREAGRLCWEAATKTHSTVEVRVTRHGEPFTFYELPAPRAVSSFAAQNLIRRIHVATQAMWIDKPSELVNIHAGKIRSRAGSYDQWYTTMIFVNGEVRPLGYCAIDGLIRVAVCEPSMTIHQLKAIAPHFIKTPAEFLGYCGLDTIWQFVQETLEYLCEIETKEEFITLFETLGLYVNILNAWNLQLFPWDGWDKFQYDGNSLRHRQAPALAAAGWQ